MFLYNSVNLLVGHPVLIYLLAISILSLKSFSSHLPFNPSNLLSTLSVSLHHFHTFDNVYRSTDQFMFHKITTYVKCFAVHTFPFHPSIFFKFLFFNPRPWHCIMNGLTNLAMATLQNNRVGGGAKTQTFKCICFLFKINSFKFFHKLVWQFLFYQMYFL